MNAIIATHSLTKRYGRSSALDGLDLEVREGEVHGFLGPNGAGKSTTIRILLGLIHASGGEATVLGRDPWRDAVALHRELASVPGDVSLWPNLTGGETIDLLTALRGGADAAERARLLDAFELDPRKKARSYSKGNRQKVALVAAFAVPARLYVLDEPTSGLDPLMEEVFRAEVARVKAAGATVLLSSHILGEVEQLCDRVTIIRDGRTVESGTLAELRHLTRTAFTVATDADLTGLSGAHDIRREGDGWRFDVDTDAISPVLQALAQHAVASLTAQPPSLEDLFLRHYGAGAGVGDRGTTGDDRGAAAQDAAASGSR